MSPLAPPVLWTRVLTPSDWPLVEQLFSAKGACGGCWCMSWRVPKHGKEWEAAKGEPNRRALQALVQQGSVHAVLALADGVPVGWCTFGPRQSFPRLVNSRALQRVDAVDGTWTVVCFYIPTRWRGRGVGGRLLAAAVQEAFTQGAKEVEGIPAVPYGTGKMPGAFAWTGVPALFEQAGFKVLQREGASRPIYVRAP